MFNSYSITLMNSEWDVMLPSLKVKHIPRVGELIYLDSDKTYYNVISVIHNVSKKHSIFVIVDLYDKKS